MSNMAKAKSTATVQIKQIAERVGMSQSTVSIVLNGRGDEMRISKESQKMIQSVAKEMNYRPNIYARRLRRSADDQQEGQIICVFWNESYAEDMMTQFFRGLFLAEEKNHYGVEFMVKMFRPGRLSELKDSMTLLKYNGILIVGVSQEDLEFLNREEFDIPIVVNRPSDKYSSVYVDGYEIGAECARLFARKELSSAGLISAKTATVGMELRELGFLSECKKLGIEVRDEWIVKGSTMDMETGYECACVFSEMKERPSGLVMMMDTMALGAMLQFRVAGVQIPEDMAVIVCGQTPILKHISPSVAMIGISMVDTGESAIDLLMTVIHNNIKMPISKRLPLKYEMGDTFLTV